MSRKTTEQFIKEAQKTHGNLYDYSKVDYINNHTKVCIIDPEYGEFWQSPNNHLKGSGNPLRAKLQRRKSRTKTTEQFIEKAKLVHGNLYDYSKVEYISAKTKVCIIDPDYGEFWQTPNNHLIGKGNCSRAKNFKKTTEHFIQDAIKIHGDLYDYSKVDYTNAITKICIIDPDYGEFYVTPNGHLCGSGHLDRARNNIIQKLSSTTEEFIKKAREVHNDLYDYSKVEYINAITKVCIIDPEYGEFYIKPNQHLSGGNHPQRALETNRAKQRITQDEFIEKAIAVHGDLYDYSKVDFIDTKTDVCIIDPEYGEFWQKPSNHYLGKGNPQRAIEITRAAKTLTTEQFIEQAREVHGDLYDYSKVDYKNTDIKVCIIDPEYGEFWQTPSNHKNGNGHPSRAKVGFDPLKEATLYYISIYGGEAYKIGITNRTLEERFRKDMVNIKIIKTWYYPIGRDAYVEEQRVLKEFKYAKYCGRDLLENAGISEMFKYDVLNLDV